MGSLLMKYKRKATSVIDRVQVNFINLLTHSFSCANALTHNFSFINIFTINFDHFFELKVCPTFTPYDLSQKEQHKSTGAKAGCKLMVKLTSNINRLIIIHSSLSAMHSFFEENLFVDKL